MDGHPIAAHQSDREQIGRTCFHPRRRLRGRCGGRERGADAQCGERQRRSTMPAAFSKQKPQNAHGGAGDRGQTPKMGKKLLRARKYREHRTRPSSSSPSPMSKRSARMLFDLGFRHPSPSRLPGFSPRPPHTCRGPPAASERRLRLGRVCAQGLQQGHGDLAGVFADFLGLVVGPLHRSIRFCE